VPYFDNGTSYRSQGGSHTAVCPRRILLFLSGTHRMPDESDEESQLVKTVVIPAELGSPSSVVCLPRPLVDNNAYYKDADQSSLATDFILGHTSAPWDGLGDRSNAWGDHDVLCHSCVPHEDIWQENLEDPKNRFLSGLCSVIVGFAGRSRVGPTESKSHGPRRETVTAEVVAESLMVSGTVQEECRKLLRLHPIRMARPFRFRSKSFHLVTRPPQWTYPSILPVATHAIFHLSRSRTIFW